MSGIPTGRALLITIILAIASLPPITIRAQGTDSAVQEHFRAAQQAQQQGRLDTAVDEYKAVIRLAPNLPETYVNLGLTYYAQARFAESAEALATASKLRPGMRGVSLWRGIDEVKLYGPRKGVVLLREAVQQNPADKLAMIWLGTALWDSGQPDAALVQ